MGVNVGLRKELITRFVSQMDTIPALGLPSFNLGKAARNLRGAWEALTPSGWPEYWRVADLEVYALVGGPLGFSLGPAVALELAVGHPSRVRSTVPISAAVRPDGMHEDLTDPSRHATSTRMPSAQDFADMQEAYQRLSPHPEHFNQFLATLSASNADLKGWSDEQLAGITAPTLLVMGDHDFVTIEHGALMKQLIPGSHLAVLPNTTHMAATRRPELLLPMLAAFLD